MRIIAVAVLAVVLALSSAQNAFATVTLAYDSGVWDTFGGDQSNFAGVLFALPSGVSSAHLTYIRWIRSSSALGAGLTIHITGPDHVTDLTGSPITIAGPGLDPSGTGCPAGWPQCSGLDVTSYGIVLTGDFFVILDSTNGGGGLMKDNGPFTGHSYDGASLQTLALNGNQYDKNLFVRVDIDPTYAPSGPVGGFMEPVNKLAVFAPYLALFGVIGTVAVIVWKRPDN